MAVDLMKLPKITKIKHNVEPMWASDAGRNSNSGKYSGTFIGYFDTLEVNVGKVTQEELSIIRDKIEVPIIENVSFTDSKSKTGATKTESFYGTAIGVEIISDKMVSNKKRYPAFSFTLTAISRRTDM